MWHMPTEFSYLSCFSCTARWSYASYIAFYSKILDWKPQKISQSALFLPNKFILEICLCFSKVWLILVCGTCQQNFHISHSFISTARLNCATSSNCKAKTMEDIKNPVGICCPLKSVKLYRTIGSKLPVYKQKWINLLIFRQYLVMKCNIALDLEVVKRRSKVRWKAEKTYFHILTKNFKFNPFL